MLYSEIIAVCSEIHTKHINTPCVQNVEFVNVKLGGTVTNGLQRSNGGQKQSLHHVAKYRKFPRNFHSGRIIERNYVETGSCVVWFGNVFCCVHSLMMEQQEPLKRRYTPTRLRSVTFQKKAVFTVTAVCTKKN
jgi:hypothetical protein